MANKQLTARLRLDTSQAERKLDALAKKMNKIDSAVNRMGSGTSGVEHKLRRASAAAAQTTTNVNRVAEGLLNAAQRAENLGNRFRRVQTPINAIRDRLLNLAVSVDGTGNKLTKIINKVRQWWTNQRQVTSATRNTQNALDGIFSRLKGIAATYLGIMGGRALINTSDTITAAQNKLNYVTAQQMGAGAFDADGGYSDAVFQNTQETMDKMYTSAQKVRMGYTDMMSNVSKTMALAGDAFGNNIDNAIRFQEIMAEAYTVGGASAAEMSTSMYQLTQALGAGILAGDELRSVREGAPLAYKEIEKFVQGVFDTEESLKDLASQGKVTADMVVAAIMNAGDKMDNAFAQTEVRFNEFWTQVKSAATKAFEPVAIAMRDLLNSVVDSGAISKIENFLTEVSKGLQIIFALFERGVNWVADNWYWLEGILLKGIITVGTMMVGYAIYSAAAWLVAHWAFFAVGAVIYWLIGVLNKWRNGVVETCKIVEWAILVLGAVLLAVAAKVMFAWLVTYGIMTAGAAWAVLAIIAVIVLLAWFIFKHLDVVCGVVWAAGAFIYNVFAGVMHGILQALYAITEPFIGIIEWLVNAWNGAFTSIGGAFANFCGQLLAGLIGLVKPFAALLDKIFGWDVNGAIESAQATMRGWGKTEAAVTYSVDKPVGLERKSYSDAFANGYEWGADKRNSINEWGNSVANKVNGVLGGNNYDVNDMINEKLAIKNGKPSFMDNLGDALGIDTTSPSYDSGGSLNPSVAEDLLGDIADNTGSIADSMDLTAEDLKYLRDVANMEWKKEFTTANIVVDMTNNNTISSDMDLDKLFIAMKDMVEEEMYAVADGAYAY